MERWAKVEPANTLSPIGAFVDLMRSEGADNLQWVWHVNWLTSQSKSGTPSRIIFRRKVLRLGGAECLWPDHAENGRGRRISHSRCVTAYPRLLKIAPGKPIIIAEFGCDLHNKHCDAAEWAAMLWQTFLEKMACNYGFAGE